MSTYLDDMLTAQSTVVRSMVSAKTPSSTILGNGSILIETKLSDSVAMRSVRFDGADAINFASYQTPGTPTIRTQSLHLGNGVFTETYAVPSGTLTIETLALRQHAPCALQSLTLPAGMYAHVPLIPDSVIVDGADHISVHSNGTPVPCMRLRAHDRRTGERMAYLGAYLSQPGVAFTGLDTRPTDASNRFTVSSSGTLQVLHTLAVGPDADMQVTNYVSSALQTSQTASAFRAAHTMRWASLWRAGVQILPRQPTPDPEVAIMNVVLRAAQYRLLSMRRDGGRVALTRTGPSWYRSSSLATALLPTVPDLAKGAAQDSLSDSLAESVTDNTFVNPSSPKLEELASSVLDVWHTFRATLDRSWLRVVSTDVYRAANAITQHVEATGLPDTDPVTLEVPLTSTGFCQTRLGPVTSEHALSTHLCKMAVSAATQIAYDLRDIPPPEWLAVYNQLVVPMTGDAYVYSSADPSLTGDQTLVYHPLVFSPPRNKVLANVLLAGATTAEASVSSPDPKLRLGAVAVLASAAPLKQTPVTAMNSAGALLTAEANYATNDLWRSLAPNAGAAQEVEASAAFLSTVVYGFMRMRMKGIVDRDGVHIERSQAALEPLARMPYSWAGAKVSVAGPTPAVKIVSNQTV